MKKKWRHWALCAVLAAGSALGASLLSNIRFFQILNLKAYDAHFVVRDWLANLLGRRPDTSNIVLLLADQKTFDTFRELRIFWHQHYANVIRAAGQAGAKVIGLDLDFGIPVDKYEPDFDRSWARQSAHRRCRWFAPMRQRSTRIRKRSGFRSICCRPHSAWLGLPTSLSIPMISYAGRN